MSTDRRGGWSQTYSGRVYYGLDPRPDEIFIEDIAHALSLMCRFNGHVRCFYGVGEHSVRVAGYVDRAMQLSDVDHPTRVEAVLAALLHDASEAYLVDLVRPVKLHMPEFQVVEEQWEEAIKTRFQLVDPFPWLTQAADERLLATEARDLMAEPPMPWGLKAPPLPSTIRPWGAPEAEDKFLLLFNMLLDQRAKLKEDK